MPAAAPVQPIAPPPVAPAPAPSPYLSQGLSTGIPGFNPMVPGGGMYAEPPAAAPAAQSDVPPAYYSMTAVGQPAGLDRVTGDRYAPGHTFEITPEVAAANPVIASQLPPWHPSSPSHFSFEGFM